MSAIVIISTDFFESFIRLPLNIQNKVRDFFDKFTENPNSSGINLEKINKVSDKQLYSVRIDDTYRGIVFKEQQKAIYHLLWIDHHEKAYDWANNKTIVNINNETSVYSTSYYESMGLSLKNAPSLLGRISNKDLLALGVPLEHINFIKNVPNINAFSAIKELLPVDVYSNLEFLAYGFHVQDVIADERKKKKYLVKYIETKVINPALKSKVLDEETKKSIEHTSRVLNNKKTVSEILDFFAYALDSVRGKQIRETLHKAGLKAFEDIKNECEDLSIIKEEQL